MCSCLFIEMNQTAHISLQNIPFSKSVETNKTGCARFFLARPASFTSDFVLRLVAVCLRFRFRPARLAPRCCVAAASVRGYLRLVPGARNPFF